MLDSVAENSGRYVGDDPRTMAQIQDPQNPQTALEEEIVARLAAAAESLLFVAGRPLEYTELRKLLDPDDPRLARVLDTLSEQLASQGRGIRVQRLGKIGRASCRERV